MIGSHDQAAGSVLVVDDELGVREVIREALEDEGFVTLAARDGREAVDNLTSGLRPCLIVLDLMMPRMSGWEFASWLLAEEELRSIPFVIVTAYGRGLDTDALRRAEAVLTKPLQLDELIEVVGRHCSGSESRQ